MIKTKKISNFSSCSLFISPFGNNEYFLTNHTKTETSFTKALDSLYKSYLQSLKKLGLSENTQIFSRFYLSDIANQKKQLLTSDVYKICQSGAVSIIQQCPLNGNSVSLLSYHILNKKNKFKKTFFKFDDEGWRNGIKIKGDNYDLFYTANFSGFGFLNSFEQTNEIFSSYNSFLNDNDMTLLKNAVRTWIYVRDIDNHYQGMVDSRKDYFLEQGLIKQTRYLASTGIEAKLKEVNSLVSMDALTISHLKPEQIVRMEALENLNPTSDYGVTFERGSKVMFGDRSHLFISGTASIDKHGQVMFPEDVEKQTERTLENISALLKPHGATLRDMVYFIVYLRNITEFSKVIEVLNKKGFGNVPTIIVEGSVCRPTWLVEIEGIGIISATNKWPNFF